MQLKAYSYIRFSSPEQAKGDSYRRQREAAETYCKNNGLELVDSREYLFFDKGRSAYKAQHLDDNGELARFLSYVENGAIPAGSYLIIESLDRLSREKVKDALPRFLDLLNKGINIYTSADCRLYTADYNELDLFVSIFHMSRAHNESSIKGDRVSKAWRQKQEHARESMTPLGAACPYWMKFEDGAYTLIPERVFAIKRIFQLAMGGIGQRLIAKTLNAEGIPIFGSKNRNKNGAWGSSSVGKILSNRALLGEYQPTGLIEGKRDKLGEPVQGFYPVVVTEEVFYAAAKSRSEKRVSKATKQSKNFNVWQGIAKCKLCSESMHLVNKGHPPKGAKYLRCYGAVKGVCSGQLIRLDRSEEIFREILAKVDSLSLVQDNQNKLKNSLNIQEGKILEINSRLKELQHQILVLGGRLPSTLVGVIAQLESDLEVSQSTREKIKADLSRERIINKGDFFARLDLVSYEGRARANSLIKGLDAIINIERGVGYVNYTIQVEGRDVLCISDEGDKIVYIPYERSYLDVVELHKDDGSLLFSLGASIVDLGEYEASLKN